MGDENSLAGTTKAHKHTSPASDGGFLETAETGVTNMSQGSIGYYNASSVLTELTAGNSADVLTMGVTDPAWSAPVSSAVWTEVINEYDNVASNTLNTGYIDLGQYRVLKLFWSAYLETGTGALDLRFYNPDQNVESAAIQGCSGFYNSSTFFGQGNQTSYNLTNGGALFNGRDIILEMTLLCASVKNDGAGGSYSLSQRESYDSTMCGGNLFQAWNSGLVSPDLMWFNGLGGDLSGNTWTDGILSVLAMGDNTQ